MNEENVGVKISMPLIDDIELQRIDTFYNDIVSEYTKAFVKEKEQVITQRLMMNLQQENARLKDKIEKANVLTKRIKDDVWRRMADCYEDEDNYNGDFLNTEINSIDRLLELLKEN